MQIVRTERGLPPLPPVPSSSFAPFEVLRGFLSLGSARYTDGGGGGATGGRGQSVGRQKRASERARKKGGKRLPSSLLFDAPPPPLLPLLLLRLLSVVLSRLLLKSAKPGRAFNPKRSGGLKCQMPHRPIDRSFLLFLPPPRINYPPLKSFCV